MRKLVSILLAIAMVLAMGTAAFAEETTGKITINNARVGETYTIYQLLKLESYNADSGAYSYKATAKWEVWLRTQTAYVSFDDQGYVTWVAADDDATVQAFAKAAQAYAVAEDSGIAADGSDEADSTTVEFTGLDLGYYLVDTSLGTLCSLDTTDTEVNIYEKNDEPLIEKKVEEDSTSDYGDTNDADVGDVVNFKTTITAYAGAESYIVHDILSNGLTLDQDSIEIVGLTEGTDYTVVYPTEACTGNTATCDFHIVFDQTYLDTLTDSAQIVITYSATVNANAVVGLSGNPNETVLQYSKDNWTEWDETTTYTWDMSVLKYGNGNEGNVLDGAKFVLLSNDKTKVATFTAGKLTGWEEHPDGGQWPAVGTWPAGAELTTDEYGKIEVSGLDADTYYLRETQAPAGYNKLAADVQVVITSSKTTSGEVTYTPGEAKINNNSGTELPETGATGTVVFVTVGSLVAMMAVVFMVTRKKMSIYEN